MSSRSALGVIRIGNLLRRDRALDVARVVVEPVVADGAAEILRGDVLELVRFVHDRVARVRDDFAERVLPHRRVGAQQVMVDDDDVGFGGALAHFRDEALGELGAVGADAVLAGRCDLAPERQIFRQIFHLGAIARLGVAAPFVDALDGERFFA